MIFYASGALAHVESDLVIDMLVRYEIDFLASFAYRRDFDIKLPKLASRLRAERKKLHMMVDSGAFTAWSSGKEVNLEQLIDECNRLQDSYNDCLDMVFVSLDRLPGRKGIKPTAKEIADGALESFQTFEKMTRLVRGPVKPVYHLGDPEWVARRYEKEVGYIGLGASRDVPYEARRRWAHEMGHRFAGHPLHGLAMTGTRMLRTVRWHSVDSATWIQWAGFGNIAWLLPNGALRTISVSRESPNNKRADAHLSTLSKMHQEEIIEGLKEYEIPLEKILTTMHGRGAINMLMYKRACDWAAKQSLTDERSLGVFDDA